MSALESRAEGVWRETPGSSEGVLRDQSISFAPGFTDEQQRAVEACLARREAVTSYAKDYPVYELGVSECVAISGYRVLAQDSLNSLGLQSMADRIPTLERIHAFSVENGERLECEVTDSDDIILLVPASLSGGLATESGESYMLHEFSHTLPNKVVTEWDDSSHVIGWDYGLDRFSIAESCNYGMYEEPLAELFAAYTMARRGYRGILSTPYQIQVPLFIAFLEKFAELTKGNPLNVFQHAYKSHLTQDKRWEGEVERVFDNADVPWQMRNIARTENWITMYDVDQLVYIGEMGKRYTKLREDYLSGSPIYLPGLPVGFVKETRVLRDNPWPTESAV